MEQYAQDAEQPQELDMGIACEFPVKARRYYKKGVRQKEMKMLMELVIIKDDETGEIVGRLASDMGGGVVISDDRNHEQWHIPPRELWEAYDKMRKEMIE